MVSNGGVQPTPSDSVSATLNPLIRAAIERHGGWLPFDRFMALALYAPGAGYYANHSRKFGALPGSGSDFITAPELSPLFGRALARAVAQALLASATRQVWEFGAGSGELAAQLLDALGDAVDSYTIVELSATLRARQQARLSRHIDRVRWVDALPPTMLGVVVGNELLDAMPVQLLRFDGDVWFERGVTLGDGSGPAWCWSDRPTTLRPPLDARFQPGTVVELHAQATAFVTTLAERLQRGAVYLIDYGFPQAEYYHPQRVGGTLMCHRAHRADTDPLTDVGEKDITAHVDFTAVALAAQDAGLDVLGYTSQAHFLMNCAILDDLRGADLRTIANAQKLLNEHEMGELFKVIGLAKGCEAAFGGSPLGFGRGDRTHTL